MSIVAVFPTHRRQPSRQREAGCLFKQERVNLPRNRQSKSWETLFTMLALTVDPRYSDSYSECGSSSSSSSFSNGILTPASSTHFSAAPSRRQSIASEGQSCIENAFDRVPNYSSDGAMTPLRTPPPFHNNFHPVTYPLGTQGCDADFSPMVSQQHRGYEVSSMPSDTQLQEAFIPHSLNFDPSGISGFDGDIYDQSRQDEGLESDLRPTERPEMDWSTNFNLQTYYQSESVQNIATFDFDSAGRRNTNDIHHSQTSSGFADFSPFDEFSTAATLPQTIAPQQTVVYPHASYTPGASTYPPLESSIHTPEIKLENNAGSSSAASTTSDFSPCTEQDSQTENELPVWKHEKLEEDLASVPSRRSTRSKKSTRDSNARLRGRARRVGVITVHDPVEVPHSTTKRHKCLECNKCFDRPEHYKRHRDSTEEHVNQRKKMGLPVDARKELKPYKCKVPHCIEKGFAGVTRKDNLKPHYQKTHFFYKEDGKESRKRNAYVSPAEARDVLGLEEWDPRVPEGRLGKQPRIDPCKYD